MIHFQRLIIEITLGVVLCLIAIPTHARECSQHVGCTLRVANTLSATNLNTNADGAWGAWNLDLTINLFEGLLTTDEAGKPLPGQAERWEISEDGLTYRLFLREDAVWNDGNPVLADHFIIPWKATFESGSTGFVPMLLSNVENAAAVGRGDLPVDQLGVRALDDKTVEIRLSYPQNSFLAVLANPFLTPAPPQRAADYSRNDVWTSADDLAFNGPYELVGSIADVPVVLRKNIRFHDASEVVIDTVEIWPSKDDGTTVGEFLAGKIDIVQFSPNKHLNVIRSLETAALVENGAASSTFLKINLQRPKLQNPLVRRALAMTTISEQLVSVSEFLEPTPSFVSPRIAGHPAEMPLPDWAGLSFVDRVSEARALMEQAGYNEDNPLRLELKLTDSSQSQGFGNILKSVWSKIHIDVTLVITTRSEHFSAKYMVGRNYDVGEWRWLIGANTVFDYLNLLRGDSPINFTGWRNSAYEGLLLELAATSDQEIRDQIVSRMIQIVNEELPVIPIYRKLSDHLVQADLRGYVSNQFGLHPYRYLRWNVAN